MVISDAADATTRGTDTPASFPLALLTPCPAEDN